MSPDTAQMCGMWNEAKMFAFHYNMNCCILCILYGAASKTESVLKVAKTYVHLSGCFMSKGSIVWELAVCVLSLPHFGKRMILHYHFIIIIIIST